MTPCERYQLDCQSGLIKTDPRQEEVCALLTQLQQQLQQTQRPKLWQKLQQFRRRQEWQPVMGLYLWGGVGIGKTYLMDTLMHCIATIPARRQHFHQFMRHIHLQLKALSGLTNPLDHIAAQIAQQVRLLCLDEFMVEDIGDAMLLAGLLQGLFQRGVVLVTTSNVVPQALYQYGLARDRFKPAIQLLEQHTQVFHLATNEDYRARHLAVSGVYFQPCSEQSELSLREMYSRLVPSRALIKQETITILDRPVQTRSHHDGVVWFDFSQLCAPPRSQSDYLAIAARYHTVLLSNVPLFAPEAREQVTYFINLIDVLYDAGVNLILSAAGPLEELYRSGEKQAIFQRTLSRLQEMQTSEYLHQPHRTTYK